MSANDRRDPDSDPDSAELRSTLRAWTVPGPPPDLEGRLRATFRRRRAAQRRALWLAAAAVLAVAAALFRAQVTRPVLPDRPTRPSGPAQPPERAAAGPSAEPERAAVPPVIASGAQSARPRVARRLPPVTAGYGGPVIVEADQAALLSQLGQQLARVRQAPPGVTVPRVEVAAAYAAPPLIPEASDADVPRYETSWEPVAGEWPVTRHSVPSTWR